MREDKARKGLQYHRWMAGWMEWNGMEWNGMEWADELGTLKNCGQRRA